MKKTKTKDGFYEGYAVLCLPERGGRDFLAAEPIMSSMSLGIWHRKEYALKARRTYVKRGYNQKKMKIIKIQIRYTY